MKEWLSATLAELSSRRVATGFEFYSFSSLFPRLIQDFSQASFLHLSALEWGWAIEGIIRDVLSTKDPSHPLWDDLHRSLFPHVDQEKTWTHFARSLGKVFFTCDRFGGKDWKNIDTKSSFEKKLWNFVRQQLPIPCSLYEAMEDLIPQAPERPCEIHLFSISFITRTEFSFLQKLHSFIPVHWYLLSPCALFWGDIASDRERFFLREQEKNSQNIDALDRFLCDRNTLLANFGRLGRETTSLITDNPTGAESAYSLPSIFSERPEYLPFIDPSAISLNNDGDSLLHRIQTDILLLRPAWKDPQSLSKEPLPSIQLHAAPSLLREVEILYNNLLAILDNEHSALAPKDCIVIAPDILVYQPYIDAVFGGEESLLPYQIIDITSPLENTSVKGFCHLIRLSQSRWDPQALFSLLTNPVFLLTKGWKREQVDRCWQWIVQTGVRWGMNGTHRNDILIRSHCKRENVQEEDRGTWQSCIASLIDGVTFANDPFGVEGISLTDAEWLGEFDTTLKELFFQLEPLVNGTTHSIEEWGTTLLDLAKTCFLPEDADREVRDSFLELSSLLSPLITSSQKKCVFPFSSLVSDIEESLQTPSLHFRNHSMQVVRFCSFLPMRTIPGGIIALLGMEEDHFPRKTNPQMFHQQQKLSETYFPSSTDMDRYLFLEALISCRTYFLMSYQGYRSSDGKRQSPSLLIQELLHEVEKGYSFEGESVVETLSFSHPFRAHDPMYFSSPQHLYQFSPSHFSIAQQLQKEEEPSFSLPLNTPSLQNPSPSQKEDEEIPLNDLLLLAKNPVKYFFSSHLSARLDAEEKNIDDEQNEGLLSPLERYLIHHQALQQPLEETLSQFRDKKRFPYGIWGDIATNRLDREIASFHNFTPFSQSITLHFVPHVCAAEQKAEGEWLIPSMSVTHTSGKKSWIRGTLRDIFSEGLVIWRDDTLQTTVSLWPKILLFAHALHLAPHIASPTLLFPRKQKKRPLILTKTPSTLLQHWLDYREQAQSTLSPLFPEWIPPFLTHQGEDLRQAITLRQTNLFTSVSNPYAERILASSPSLEHLDAWAGVARHLFSSLHQEWYAKKGNPYAKL